MIALACFLALSIRADVNSPAVWIAPPNGRLFRADRDGGSQQTFDAYPKLGTVLFRNRQLAFDDGSFLTWITGANGTAHATVEGKKLIGWRDSDPLLFDGNVATTPSGQKVDVELKEGDTPVFVALTGGTGLVVSQTKQKTLLVSLMSSHPIAADFGNWTLQEARMLTSTSGYLLLSGAGSAVVRIAKGRADIVAIDSEHTLGVGLASDGTVYVTRPSQDEDSGRVFTDVLEVGERGKNDLFCSVSGSCSVIDLDRKQHLLYVVRHTKDGDSYVRLNYALQVETTIVERVSFVTPAFGGPGFVAPPISN